MIFMLEIDWHCRIYDRSKKFVFPLSLILRFYQNAWVFGHLLFIVKIHFVDTQQHFLRIFSIYFQFYISRYFTTHIIVLKICYCKKTKYFLHILFSPFAMLSFIVLATCFFIRILSTVKRTSWRTQMRECDRF